jgi:hypothetical protein
MDHFVELAKVLAWPVVIMVIVLSFRVQLIDLFERFSGFTFEVPGMKLGLTVKEVHDVAQELFKEVSEGLSNLSDDQRRLFAAVRSSNGSRTVDELTLEVFKKSFVRGSDEHGHFRTLRDSKLIRPIEGSRWRSESHPVVTPYAQTILRAAPTILAAAKPTPK